jgi:aspartate/methionine/tyrosine aminotransferase
MRFAKRVRNLRFEGAYAVLDRAQRLEKEGREIIHLEIGQPDFPTFPRVAMAGIRAITEGKTRYTSPAGVAALREALARDLGERRGLSIEPKEVVVGPGAKPFLLFPALALVEPGDEVLYPDPGFPSYEAIIGIVGGKPVPFPLREEGTFTPDVDALERLATERTRLIILNSPGNPTGGVMPREDLERVAAVAKACDCYVLSDEIYSRMIFGGAPHLSIAALPGMKERTIILDGFSKTYGMTGWRLGYAAMPVALAERVELLLTHVVGSTAAFTQYAGIEAVTGPQDDVEAARVEFERRRDAIVAGLCGIPGVRCQKPDGAMYVFPNVKAFGRSSDELAEYLLVEAGVAVLPGNVFGQMGEGYLRLCYANSLERIERAIEQMGYALAKLERRPASEKASARR